MSAPVTIHILLIVLATFVSLVTSNSVLHFAGHGLSAEIFLLQGNLSVPKALPTSPHGVNMWAGLLGSVVETTAGEMVSLSQTGGQRKQWTGRSNGSTLQLHQVTLQGILQWHPRKRNEEQELVFGGYLNESNAPSNKGDFSIQPGQNVWFEMWKNTNSRQWVVRVGDHLDKSVAHSYTIPQKLDLCEFKGMAVLDASHPPD